MDTTSHTPRSGSESPSLLEKPVPVVEDRTDAHSNKSSTETPARTSLQQSAAIVDALDDGYLPRKKLLPVFGCIYIAFLLVALDKTIIATALPQITNDFNSLDDLQWYSGAYMLTTSCFMLTFGRLYGFYSPKWIFLCSIFIFEIGSALSGAAPNSIAFIIGRAIAGIGGAGATGGSMIIIVHTVPLHKRPMYSSFLGSAFAISSIVGPIVGGAFTSSSATWRWCFYINLPFGAIALGVIAFVLPPIQTNNGSQKPLREQLYNLDPFGLVLFLPSMICLVLALQWGGTTYSWSDGRVIALLVVFGLTFIGFVAVQFWKGDDATVPPRIIGQRSMAAGSWFAFFNSCAMITVIFMLPIWFQAVQGVSAVDSGIRIIPTVLGLVVMSIIAGVSIRFLGYYTPFMIASSVLQATGVGLLTTLSPSTTEGQWIGYQFIYGAGLGLGMQQAGVAAQTVLAKKDVAIGISLVFWVNQLGGPIWIAVAQYLFEKKLASGLSQLPGFDVAALATAGATDIRNLVPAAQLSQVLEIYSGAIDVAFQSALGVACVAVLGALCMEWKSTKAELEAQKAAKRLGSEKA